MTSTLCPGCGAGLTPSAEQCPGCGRALSSAAPAPAATLVAEGSIPPPLEAGGATLLEPGAGGRTLAEPPPIGPRAAAPPGAGVDSLGMTVNEPASSGGALNTVQEGAPSALGSAATIAEAHGATASGGATFVDKDGSGFNPAAATVGSVRPASATPPPSSPAGILPSSRGSATPFSGGGILPSHKQTASSSAGGRSSLLQSGPASFGQGAEGTPALFDNGKYEIIKEIARGGMGAVYKARQRDLNRVVALKVMLSGAMASEGEKKRFLREAEASAKLKHPNIVPVYDIGEVDGNLYFTMDFVEGSPLSEKKKDLDRDGLLTVMIKVCDAVAYAHMRGIIHRDLKPANVMMDKRGEPLIMDFGLAKETSAENERGEADVRTREGSIMGTPHYMPPEQAEGLVSEIDVRSDVYALGVILYELWTGKLPFNAKRVSDLMRMVIESEPPSPRTLDPSVPWEIEAIALKAMEKQKVKRYDSAMEMKRDLERFKSGELIAARKADAFYRFKKWVRKNRFQLVGAGAVFAVIAGLGWFSYLQANKARLEALAKAEKAVDAAVSDVAGAREKVDRQKARVAAFANAPLGSRLRDCDALRVEVEATLQALVVTRNAIGPNAQLPAEVLPRAQRPSEDAGLLETTLRELANALQLIHEAETAEATRLAKVATARRTIDEQLTQARALHAANDPGEQAAVNRAREQCYVAIALGAQKEVEPALTELRTLDAEIAQRKERAERHAKALAALAESRTVLASAGGAANDEARLGIAKKAAAVVEEGEKSEPLPELHVEGERAKLLYARTLKALNYLRLADLEAQQVDTAESRALLDEIRALGALAEANKALLADAKTALDACANASADARVSQAEDALKKLAGVRPEALERKAFDELQVLRTQARSTSAMARAQVLYDAAERLSFDGTDKTAPRAGAAAKPDLADEAWKAAIAEYEGLPRALADVQKVDPEWLAKTIARAQGRRGLVHLGAAKRHREAANWSGALNEATLAATCLGLGRFDADKKDADLIADAATRELATPSGMILIPELSSVQIGGAERNPLRTVDVRGFYVARLEVTNEDFAKFVNDRGYERRELWDPAAPWDEAATPPRAKLVDRTGASGPGDWERGAPSRGREKLPVTFVSWFEADAYARWCKRRLPTDEEWEVAARVKPPERDAKLSVAEFPWGDLFAPVGVQVAQTRTLLPVSPTGAHEADRSAFGCYDLAGNVSEWVAPSTDERLKVAAASAPVRGGSFLLPLPELWAARHRAVPARLLRSGSVGFRLAQNVTRNGDEGGK